MQSILSMLRSFKRWLNLLYVHLDLSSIYGIKRLLLLSACKWLESFLPSVCTLSCHLHSTVYRMKVISDKSVVCFKNDQTNTHDEVSRLSVVRYLWWAHTHYFQSVYRAKVSVNGFLGCKKRFTLWISSLKSDVLCSFLNFLHFDWIVFNRFIIAGWTAAGWRPVVEGGRTKSGWHHSGKVSHINRTI